MKRASAPAGVKPRPPVSAGWLLALLAWGGILFWALQARQPLLGRVIAQFLPLDRFGDFHAAVFFPHLLSTFKNVALAVGFFLGAWGCGIWALEKGTPETSPRLEKNLLALGLGLFSFSMLMFLLGALGGYHVRILAPLFGLWVFAGLWNLKLRWKTLKPAPGWWWGRRFAWPDRILGLAVLGTAAAVYISTNTPELFFDALVYHLGVPSQWIIHGGFFPMPTVFFSNLPMNIEMLYTGALLLSDESLCRMLHAGMGTLAVLGVFALGRRWFGRRAAFWASGIFALTPVMIFNAPVSGVDAGAAFFTVLAMILIFKYFFSGAQGSRGAWLAGAFTGAALGCKYNTAFSLAPVLLVSGALWFNRTQDRNRFPAMILKIAAGALICLSPWLVKNLVVTGNPFYPFLYKVIPSRYVQPDKMQQQMDGFKEYGKRSWAQFVRQPWDLTFYYPTANSYIGTIYLFLLPGLFLLGWTARRAPPVQNAMLASAVVSVCLWSSQTQITRYLIPTLPLLALLGAEAMNQVERFSARVSLAARYGILGLAAWALLNTAAIGLLNWDPLGVSLGLQDRETFLNQRLMTSYRPMARWVNRQPGKIKVYAFGETRAYYFEKPVTTSTVYDANPLLQWLEAGPDAEAVWRHLREAGYTHLFVHAQEAVRTRGYEPYRWSPGAVERWQVFMARYAKRVAIMGEQTMYALLPQPDPAQPVKTGRPLFSYDPDINARVSAHYDQAMFFSRQGRWMDAQVEWQQIMTWAPAWSVPYVMLGWQCHQQQKLDEALNWFQRAEALADLDPEAYNDMGVLNWSLSRQQEALRCLRLALVLAPEFEAARKNLMLMEAALKETAKK